MMDLMGDVERTNRPCAVGVLGFLWEQLGGWRRCRSRRCGNLFIFIFFKMEYLGQRKKNNIC